MDYWNGLMRVAVGRMLPCMLAGRDRSGTTIRKLPCAGSGQSALRLIVNPLCGVLAAHRSGVRMSDLNPKKPITRSSFAPARFSQQARSPRRGKLRPGGARPVNARANHTQAQLSPSARYHRAADALLIALKRLEAELDFDAALNAPPAEPGSAKAADQAAAAMLAALNRLSLALEAKYSPDQPRVPAGNPDGGQWTDAGGSVGSGGGGGAGGGTGGLTRVAANSGGGTGSGGTGNPNKPAKDELYSPPPVTQISEAEVRKVPGANWEGWKPEGFARMLSDPANAPTKTIVEPNTDPIHQLDPKVLPDPPPTPKKVPRDANGFQRIDPDLEPEVYERAMAIFGETRGLSVDKTDPDYADKVRALYYARVLVGQCRMTNKDTALASPRSVRPDAQGNFSPDEIAAWDEAIKAARDTRFPPPSETNNFTLRNQSGPNIPPGVKFGPSIYRFSIGPFRKKWRGGDINHGNDVYLNFFQQPKR